MRAALIAFLLALAFASPASADRFGLKYSAYAIGIVSLGEISVDADLSQDSYEISASLQSGGIMNLFERRQLTAEATGASDRGAVRWLSYDLDPHYSHKHRVIAMPAGPD